MDRKHRLEAPHNDSLQSIEQLRDRSELSTVYFRARSQWEGDIVSEDERQRRRKDKEDHMSFGIRKQFWAVGILAPLPLVLLSLLLGVIFTLLGTLDVRMLVIPMMIGFLVWGVISFSIIKKIFALFYKNGLRAGPFLAILLTFLGLSIQIIYVSTIALHNHQLMSAVLVISALELVWSIVMSYALLLIWTTPAIGGGVKVGILAFLGIALLVSAAALTFF